MRFIKLIKQLASNFATSNRATLYSWRNKKTAVIIKDVGFGHILENKHAIVTGGSSGIGLAIAKKLIECGAMVTIVGRNPEKTQKVAQELNCDHIILDLADTHELLEKVSNYIKDKHIDILVNSAGITDKEPWLEKTPENFDLVMGTNLKSVYFMCQTIAKHMIKNEIQGHILNVSSSSSMRPGWGPYQLSKRALNGLTLGFADKLAPKGITVNALAPGVTVTPMTSSFMDSENLAYYNPLRRAETPEEIANLAAFLVSDLGASIVGDTVMITGGSGMFTSSR